MILLSLVTLSFFVSGFGDHRDLHVLTHSVPTRRSSDLNYATPCVSPPVAGVGEREHEAIGPRFSRNLRRSHGARGARRAAPIRSLRRIPGRTSSILHELTDRKSVV